MTQSCISSKVSLQRDVTTNIDLQRDANIYSMICKHLQTITVSLYVFGGKWGGMGGF